MELKSEMARLWKQALLEDGAERDVTSLVSVSESAPGKARLVARGDGVFAGGALFDFLQEEYAGRLQVDCVVSDNQELKAGTLLATLAGPMRLLLGIERTLLNFLQRMCGVAGVTRQYAEAVAHTKAKIYDTRKTLPGWRVLDKYAVRCGGGYNHRMGLHDAVLVKDNHLAGLLPEQITAVASAIVEKAQALTPPPDFIEFEVDNLRQFDALVNVMGIDVILLDNFSTEDMAEAVRRRDQLDFASLLDLEASGGVHLDSVRAIAESGVDRISVGALTHSVPAMDIAMDVEG